MANYVLSTSFNRSNIQDRLWYAMTESDKTAMLSDPSANLTFGDKVYIIATKKLYIFGADNQWHEM